MDAYALSDPTWHAGQDSPEPPKDLVDYCFDAEDLLRDARKIASDDLAAQNKLKREALLAAREAIDAAVALLLENK